MKVKIKGKEFELHYSMRMHILYENVMGKSVAFDESNSYTSLITFLYCAIIATIQKDKLDLVISYDEFMDWLDDNNPIELIKEFSLWVTQNITLSNDLSEKIDDQTKEKKIKQAKKSKN